MSENNKEIIISVNKLRKLVETVFVTQLVPENQAKIAADVLITAELRGISSHGCARIDSYYLPLLKNKTIQLGSVPIVLQEDPSYIHLDAQHSFGFCVANDAMNRCIYKAKRTGKGIASVINSTHFGIASYYTLMAASENLIGIIITNGSPAVVPPGGLKPIIGTNAISFSFPYLANRPIVFDMGMSAVSLGDLALAASKKEKVPSSWCAFSLLQKFGCLDEKLIDADIIYENRMITPLGAGDNKGELKGFLLSLMIDLLLSLLFGSDFSFKLDKGQASHLLIAFDPTHFISKKVYIDKIEQLVSAINSYEVLDGFNKLRIPGLRSNLLQEKRLKEGIPININILKRLLNEVKNSDFEMDIGIA